MASGEFTSMSAIYAATPDFCPWPIAWGTYESMPDVHFFLCEFHVTTNELLDLHSFPAKMAALHREGTSPAENTASRAQHTTEIHL
jgi:protein-ribulosamine 3-kinase